MIKEKSIMNNGFIFCYPSGFIQLWLEEAKNKKRSRTHAEDISVLEVVSIVEKTVGSKRHDQDAKAEIGHAKT